MTLAEAKLTWTQRYRRDPDLAQSIVESLQRSIAEADSRIDKLESALERIRDCDWKGQHAEILSHWEMRQIAREALE
jgi:predicted RNase H-like nuclease (RuvC/YqgF family)